MADFTRRRWTRPRIGAPRRPVDEEIHPFSEWTNDFPGFHFLLVDLPGFEKDDIKLNFDESGIIEVSGRRKVDDEKQEHFKKTFNVPEDGDVKNREMKFDGGTLRVRIPKMVKTETSFLQISPVSGWTNEFPGFHCFLVHLPGFEEDDIKLNVDESGIVEVSGRRKVDDEKQEHFEKTFNVPEDGDVNNIKKIFDGATLKVRIPKVANSKRSKLSRKDGTVVSEYDRPGFTNWDWYKDKYKADAPVKEPITNWDWYKDKHKADAPVKEPNEQQELKSLKQDETEKPEQKEQKEGFTKWEWYKDKHKADAPVKEPNEQQELKSLKQDETEKPEQKEGFTKWDWYKDKHKADAPVKEPNEQQELKSLKQDETEKPEQKEQKEGDQGPSSGQEGKSSKRSVLVKIIANKGILLAFIISFTLWVLLSQKIHPSST